MAGEPRGAIFLRFLRFGALAWGGPAAQIEMVKRECVDEQGWTSEESFRKTLAVYQVLPGPEAHELCVYFGRLRGGRLGGVLAGLGFMLPGFLLMLAISALYVEADLAGRLEAVFYGLSAAVGAVVARAVFRLGGTFVTDAWLAAIAVGAFALTRLEASFVLVLLAGGLLYELRSVVGRWRGLPSLLPLPALAALLLAGTVTLSLGAEIFWEGLRTGLLTFGGAFTAIPFLQQAAVVDQGWLTESQFLDGLAIGGVLPAPLIIFGTFVGYLAGGIWGAVLLTVGIFLPAFLLPTFFHRQLVAVSEHPRAHSFLLGVAAAAIGLIAAVAVDIVEAGVVDVWTALLAAAAFAVLMLSHAKLAVLYAVLGCGAAGALLQATVV